MRRPERSGDCMVSGGRRNCADRAGDGVRRNKKKVRWTFFPPNRPTKERVMGRMASGGRQNCADRAEGEIRTLWVRELAFLTRKALRISPEGFSCERVMGIEPTCPAWKAGVLPLNYTRKVLMHFNNKWYCSESGEPCQGLSAFSVQNRTESSPRTFIPSSRTLHRSAG